MACRAQLHAFRRPLDLTLVSSQIRVARRMRPAMDFGLNGRTALVLAPPGPAASACAAVLESEGVRLVTSTTPSGPTSSSRSGSTHPGSDVLAGVTTRRLVHELGRRRRHHRHVSGRLAAHAGTAMGAIRVGGHCRLALARRRSRRPRCRRHVGDACTSQGDRLRRGPGERLGQHGAARLGGHRRRRRCGGGIPLLRGGRLPHRA